MAPDRISFIPNPATVGAQVQVCYDFNAPPPVAAGVVINLSITYLGCGAAPTQLALTKGQPCGNITVPPGCVIVRATDQNLLSEDGNLPIDP